MHCSDFLQEFNCEKLITKGVKSPLFIHKMMMMICQEDCSKALETEADGITLGAKGRLLLAALSRSMAERAHSSLMTVSFIVTDKKVKC